MSFDRRFYLFYFIILILILKKSNTVVCINRGIVECINGIVERLRDEQNVLIAKIVE